MANPPHNPETAPLLKQERGGADVSTTTPKKPKRDAYTFSPLLGATVAVVALAIACICAGTLRRVSTISGEGQQILYETLDEVNGTGHSVTFTVHLCGVPESVWNAKVPWPVCRVKLVGCPQNDGNCGHWRYHQGIEMTPVDDSRNAYTVTTDKFAAGDSFGFAVVEAGCTIEDESICVSEPGSDNAPAICKEQELCDHRYDVGTAEYTTQIDEPDGVGHDRTCWDGSKRCSSASPFHDLPMEQRSCLRDPHDAWLNRVLTPDMEATGAVSAVWGSCETSPSAEFKCADTSNPSAASSMCPDLQLPAAARLNAVNVGCDGKPDGSFCSLTHTAPGVDSVAVSATCCGGTCCPAGETCNVAGLCEAPADNSVCATNGGFPASGICTDQSVKDRISPGFTETDCDRTCQSALNKNGGSAHLTCVIGASDDANKCRCSQVGGHHPSECMFHPGGLNYKCSVCQTIVTFSD